MGKLKELRERTGAGMSDCHQALNEAGGDMEKAVEILRKKGIAKAAKRSEREAREGIIMVGTDDEGTSGYIAEINTETDFAAKSERFLNFAGSVLAAMKNSRSASREALLASAWKGATIKEGLDNLSGVIGEKMDIKNCTILTSGGTVAAYSHAGGRIGVLAAIDRTGSAELAKEIAMQIAAANPRYIRPEDVPAEELDKEKEIYRAQLKQEGKPDAIVEKIMTGKINKFLEETCLVKQEYIKDDKKKVQDILGDVKVEKFIRYAL
ncbi:MAG: translation elongation factor Ts [Planctomycetes bacterium]|jgi:elongation factor Ts|nr:translation elongation factor Ts [Planctomycetota bacterium]